MMSSCSSPVGTKAADRRQSDPLMNDVDTPRVSASLSFCGASASPTIVAWLRTHIPRARRPHGSMQWRVSGGKS